MRRNECVVPYRGGLLSRCVRDGGGCRRCCRRRPAAAHAPGRLGPVAWRSSTASPVSTRPSASGGARASSRCSSTTPKPTSPLQPARHAQHVDPRSPSDSTPFAIAEEGSRSRAATVSSCRRRALRALASGYFYDGRLDLAERTIDRRDRRPGADRRSGTPIGLGAQAQVMRARISYYRDDLAEMLGAPPRRATGPCGSNRTLQTASAATLAQAHLARAEYEAARALGGAESRGRARDRQRRRDTRGGRDRLDRRSRGGRSRSDRALPRSARVCADGEPRADRDRAHRRSPARGRVRRPGGAVRECRLRERRGPPSCRHRTHMSNWGCSAWRARSRTTFSRPPICRDRTRWTTRTRPRAKIISAPHTVPRRPLLGLGELAMARGDTAAGLRRFEEATTIYRQLGLAHYATRAEQLLAAGSADVQRSA